MTVAGCDEILATVAFVHKLETVELKGGDVTCTSDTALLLEELA